MSWGCFHAHLHASTSKCNLLTLTSKCKKCVLAKCVLISHLRQNRHILRVGTEVTLSRCSRKTVSQLEAHRISTFWRSEQTHFARNFQRCGLQFSPAVKMWAKIQITKYLHATNVCRVCQCQRYCEKQKMASSLWRFGMSHIKISNNA